MKYAVIRTGGKQYKVSEGDELKIEKLEVEPGKSFDFEEVLLTVNEEKVLVGKPILKTKVSAKVLDQTKAEKIFVSKYKAKTGYHKKTGHRQKLTLVKIDKIEV